MKQINILGTGNAMVTKCYNTCFTLSHKDEYFLVDAGGGNTILSQLEKSQISISNIHYGFISHNHNDHILGYPWILRAVAQAMLNKKYEGDFTLYGHPHCLEAVRAICGYVLQPKFLKLFDERIHFHAIDDKDTLTVLEHQITFFNIGSTKELQFGFHLTSKEGQTLCFLGDEPYSELVHPYCNGVDYLLHEAFCLYSQRDIFKPYEKHHATVKDACEKANELGVKNLILYHTEDKNIAHRKELYTEEGSPIFKGNLYIPNDLDCISLL